MTRPFNEDLHAVKGRSTCIPLEKKTFYSLHYLYGVSPRIARELCHKAGVDPEGVSRNLHEDELARLAALMDKYQKAKARLPWFDPLFATWLLIVVAGVCATSVILVGFVYCVLIPMTTRSVQ